MIASYRSIKIATKWNTIGFLLVFASAFVLIVYKAIHVPITHDEFFTALKYPKLSVLEIIRYPDTTPNNHILNSILTKFSIALFGNEQFVVRLPNVLSFLIYGWASYRILNLILGKNSWFFIPGALLFVTSPYLLDFFGLARGYGMAAAFCLLSASFLLSGFLQKKAKHVFTALILSMLAAYASFTVLVFTLAITGFVFLYFFLSSLEQKKIRWIPFLTVITLCGLFFLLIIGPIQKMQSNDEFVSWTSNGFFEETMKPLVHHSLYYSHIFLTAEFISYFALVLFGVNVLYLLVKWIRIKAYKEIVYSPLFIGTFIVLLTAVVNIVQCKVLGTPNLNGRTALFFYPLFIFTVISSRELFEKIRFIWFKAGVSVIVTFFTAHHVIHTLRPHSVREWSYDANTFEVIEYLKEVNHSKLVSLHTTWFFNPSFSYYAETGKTPWILLFGYSSEIDPMTTANFYYIFESDYPQLEWNFEPVMRFEDRMLVKRRGLNFNK